MRLASDIERACARLVGIGFGGLTPPRSAMDLIARGVGAVTLFARNVESPAQVADLNRQIQSHSPVKLLRCLDQEGGRVRRLRGGMTPLPSMRQLGAHARKLVASNDIDGAERLVRSVGRVMALECRAVGFDVNFAPVLDVDTNPRNPVIADRSLSGDADEVARFGAWLIDEIQLHGMAACGKHFPGHGDTDSDSHHALPRLAHGLERLEEIELRPFRACLHARSMMSAHIVFTTLDPSGPATLSRVVLGGLLRDRLGYDGLVFTDDMEMKAIADHYGYEESVVRSIEAGCDMVLVCHSPEKQARAIDALARAVSDGRLSLDRLHASLARIESVADDVVDQAGERIDPARCGAHEHREMMRRFEALSAIDPTEAWRAEAR